MHDIYAARMDTAGNVIDTTPIIVSQAQHYQSQPHVGWNGENWLVAWTTERESNPYQNDTLAGVSCRMERCLIQHHSRSPRRELLNVQLGCRQRRLELGRVVDGCGDSDRRFNYGRGFPPKGWSSIREENSPPTAIRSSGEFGISLGG